MREHRLRRVRHRLGQRGLPHRLRPELQQLACASRTPSSRRSTTAATGTLTRRTDGKRRQDACRPRALGRDRLRRLGLRRPRRAVRHHHQRVAHLPRGRPDQRLATRAPSTCSSTTPPATWRRINLVKFLRRGRAASTSRASATPSGSGPSCSRSACSWPRFPSRGRSPRRATTSAPSASATPTWAPCSCSWASRTTRAEARGDLRRAHRHHAPARPTPPPPRWRASSGPSPASRRTATPCCASSATTAAPPTTRRAAEYEGLTITPDRHRPDALPAGPARGRARDAGTGRSRSARSTATATPRSPCSRRPAPSASSWTATPPASSPTSRWSSSRSWPAAATSRSSTRPCPPALARARLHRTTRSTTSSPTASGRGTLERRARASTTTRCAAKGFADEALAQVEQALAERLRHHASPSTPARLGEEFRRATRSASPTPSSPSWNFNLLARARLHRGARSRRPTTTAAAP